MNKDNYDIETDDEDFDALLEDKRHKEIIASLNKIANAIPEKKDDNGISAALNNQSNSIQRFADAIKNIPTPQVNVQTNNQPIQGSIEKMATDILQSQNDLKKVINEILVKSQEKKEWEHNIQKDPYGNYKITSKQIK